MHKLRILPAAQILDALRRSLASCSGTALRRAQDSMTRGAHGKHAIFDMCCVCANVSSAWLGTAGRAPSATSLTVVIWFACGRLGHPVMSLIVLRLG